MDPRTKALESIKYTLDAIEELRQVNPEDTNTFETYAGRLAFPGITQDYFESILSKIESRGIASYNLNDFGIRWGDYPLTLTINDWDEFDRYREEVSEELAARTEKEIINYWNYVNPFRLLWKAILFVWKAILFAWRNKVITVLITVLTLLAIDYSLAWNNLKWIRDFILNLFR